MEKKAKKVREVFQCISHLSTVGLWALGMLYLPAVVKVPLRLKKTFPEVVEAAHPYWQYKRNLPPIILLPLMPYDLSAQPITSPFSSLIPLSTAEEDATSAATSGKWGSCGYVCNFRERYFKRNYRRHEVYTQKYSRPYYSIRSIKQIPDPKSVKGRRLFLK